MKEGLWKEFFPNGALRSVVNYKRNKFDGEIKIFDWKGKLKVLGYFSNGLKVGNWIDLEAGIATFYKNGEKAGETKIDDNLIKEYSKIRIDG